MSRRRVLMVASEAYPLAKAGGLADYVSGLAKALFREGCDVKILLPAYPSALAAIKGPISRFRVDGLDEFGAVSLIAGRTPGDVGAWLVDCPSLYARDGDPYQDADGKDWPDNARRFALLNRVGALLATGNGPLSWRPDLVHLNDWPTGPLAAMLKLANAPVPRTVFVIHNMAFLGLCAADVLPLLGLPGEVLGESGLEFYGHVSFLKAGLSYADRVVTVSESYAQEILAPEFGCGLDGALRARGDRIIGIRNGVDYDEWDSPVDNRIAAGYGAHDLAGKALCRAELEQHFGLRPRRDVPIFAYISRLTHQKMADVLVAAAPEIVRQGAQLAILGRGDRDIERALCELSRQFDDEVIVRPGYDESAAHRLLAGADALLAPARFEPCGLIQIYALRYGTLPIVSRVGGLKETVVDADPETLAAGTATGFMFDDRCLAGLLGAVERALAVYRDRKRWRAMMRNAIGRDFSWQRAVTRYLELYDDMAPVAAERRVSAPVTKVGDDANVVYLGNLAAASD